MLVDRLTAPPGVVLVGASADQSKPSGRALDYLRRYGFRGDIQVVNPRHREIAGVPCVDTIGHLLPGSAQAAIVNLPADRVTAALRELAAVDVEVAVVIGSGFEDRTSRARQDLDTFLASAGRRMRVVGPNCVGTMSIASGTHLNFSSVLQTTAPRVGGVALVTQSGATGNGLLMSLLRRGVGLAHWFSTGDELDVGALELVAGLIGRDDVTSIGLFMEAITDISWLPRVREMVRTTDKRVYLVKVADSDLGQVAAAGHTGRVVGSNDISHAVLAQSGFVRLAGLDELTDCLVVDEVVGRLPRGARAAAVSVSGAGGVILADQMRATGTLSLPPISPEVAATIGRLTGNRVAVRNPLDIPFLGETETFADILVELSEHAGFDVVLAVESSLAHDRDVLSDRLVARAAGAAPVVLTHLSEDDPIDGDLVAKLADARVAVVPTPERAVRATARVAEEVRPDTDDTAHVRPAASGRLLGLEAVAAMLPDLPWARWEVVTTHMEVAEASARFGLPLAVKAAGRTIAHRTELGAVEVVHEADSLGPAWARVAAVCEAHGDAVVVQEGAPAGHDLLVAVIRDPEYGLTVVVRPGGVLAELLDEQVVLWHGWDAATRAQMLRASRIGTVVCGYRGGRPSDLAGLEGLVESVLSALADSEIDFLEFNPIVVTPDGVHVVDAIASARQDTERP